MILPVLVIELDLPITGRFVKKQPLVFYLPKLATKTSVHWSSICVLTSSLTLEIRVVCSTSELCFTELEDWSLFCLYLVVSRHGMFSYFSSPAQNTCIWEKHIWETTYQYVLKKIYSQKKTPNRNKLWNRVIYVIKSEWRWGDVTMSLYLLP